MSSWWDPVFPASLCLPQADGLCPSALALFKGGLLLRTFFEREVQCGSSQGHPSSQAPR